MKRRVWITVALVLVTTAAPVCAKNVSDNELLQSLVELHSYLLGILLFFALVMGIKAYR